MIDDKLKEIVETNTHVGLDADGLPILVALDGAMIAEIKQAFAEELLGYTQDMVDGKLMTGQEWLTRFEKELDSGLALPEVMDIWVRKCAEKAAGL